MDKKILLALLIGLIFLPAAFVEAKTAKQMAEAIATLAQDLATAIVVIGWCIAGILYLTSGGDPGKIGTAKKALIYAIVGTAVIIVAKGGYTIISGLLNPIVN